MLGQFSIDDWAKLVGTVGIPGAFVLGLLYIIAQSLRWLRPYAEKAIEGHVELVTTLRETRLTDTENIRKMTDTLSETCPAIYGLHKATGHLCDAVHEAADDAKKPMVSVHVKAAKTALENNGK